MNKLLYNGINLTILTDNEIPLKESNISGDFLICGREVANILGYKNTSDAILRYVYPEDKITVRNKNIKPNSNIRQLNNAGEVFINESGMYSLIFNCSLPAAKDFKRWVTSEVLPQIRKTGSYNSNMPIQIDEEKVKLIIEKISLEYMMDMKTNKVLESIKYLRSYGITKRKASELVRKSMKYNLPLESVLDDYLKEQRQIESQKIEGKIKLAILSLVKLGYTQQEAWIRFAEVASNATGKDINKHKLHFQRSGTKKTYVEIVQDLKIEKESLTAFKRFVTNEKKKFTKNLKYA